MTDSQNDAWDMSDSAEPAADLEKLKATLAQTLKKAGIPEESGNDTADYMHALELLNNHSSMGRWLLERLAARKFTPAMELLHILNSADQGKPDALMQLGNMYEYGQNLNIDYPQATQCYLGALRQGEQTAKPALMRMLREHRVELYSMLEQSRLLRSVDAELTIEITRARMVRATAQELALEEWKSGKDEQRKERLLRIRQEHDYTIQLERQRGRETHDKLQEALDRRDRESHAQEEERNRRKEEERRAFEEKESADKAAKAEQQRQTEDAMAQLAERERQALESGDVADMEAIAAIYRDGTDFIKPNKAKQEKWEDCVRIMRDDPEMMRRIGGYYMKGIHGCPLDTDKAFIYFEKGKDYTSMERVLRQWFSEGHVDKCIEQTDHFFQVCDDSRLRSQIAASVEYGHYCPANPRKAYRMFLENNDVEKAENVAFRISQDYRIRGDAVRSYEWLMRSGPKKNTLQRQMAAVAALYETGAGGYPLDLLKAYSLYQNAERRDDMARVGRTLAVGYAEGTYNLPKNEELAAEWRAKNDSTGYYTSFQEDE